MTTSSQDISYLGQVSITDFRAFGSSTVDLHPGPSLVLLVGPNGLGKTSWFEAIEMALTGEVARWSNLSVGEMKPTPQVREGSSASNWSIELAFASGQGSKPFPVKRSGPEHKHGTPLASIIHEVLATNPEEWSLGESNLSSFLRSTHLLPQSVQLRMLSRKPKERWDDLLSHVSGFDRIVRAAKNAGGPTKSALQRMLKSAEKDVESADETLASWRQLRESLEAAERRRSNAPEMLSPPKARAALADLPTQTPLPLPLDAEDSEVEQLLEAIRDIHDEFLERRSELALRQSRLEELRTLPERLAHGSSLLEAATGNQKTCEATLKKTAAELDALTDREAKERHALQEHSKKAEHARKIVKRIAALRESQGAKRAAEEALQRATTEIKTATLSITQAEEHLSTAFESRRLRAAWEAQGRVLQRQETEIEEATQRLQMIEELRSESKKEERQLQEFRAALKAGQREQEASEKEVEAQQQSVGRAEAIVGQSSKRNDTIQKAVAEIAAYLPEAAIACPVCTREWTPPGTLIEKAKAAATANDPALASAQAYAASERSKLDELRERQSQIQDKVAGLGEQVTQSEARLEGLRIAILEQLDFSIFRGRDITMLAAAIKALKEKQVEEEKTWETASEKTRPAAEDQDASIEELRAQLSAKKDEQVQVAAAQEQATSDIITSESTTKALLGAIHELDPGVDGTEEERSRYAVVQIKAEEEIRKAGDRIRGTKSQREELEKTLEEHEAALSEAKARCAELEASRQGLTEEWKHAGLNEDISGTVLEQQISAARSAKEESDQHLATTDRIAASLSSWLADQEAAHLRERLAALAGGAPPEEHQKELESEAVQARERQDRIQKTRSILDRLSSHLGSSMNELKSKLASSLTIPLQRLLPTLVTDPRFHELALGLAGGAQYSSVKTSIGSKKPFQAEYYLSEGQMAGVSVAVLLAMATTFRWSRWPALLLDDPIQHNDLIHATNLIEVLRTLVLTKGFQVVLSTHDREFAEFVQKKFRNANIPGTLLRFQDPRDAGGVVPRPIHWK